jgi:hypothetical protein
VLRGKEGVPEGFVKLLGDVPGASSLPRPSEKRYRGR